MALTDILEHIASCRVHDAPPGEYVSDDDCDCGAVARRHRERIAELEADNERLRGALRVLADADTYLRHLAEWHDTGHMAAGIQSIARRALEANDD